MPLLLWARHKIDRFCGAVVRTPRRQAVADQDPIPDENFPDLRHGAYFASFVPSAYVSPA